MMTRDHISFMLGTQPVALRFDGRTSPFRSLLSYLREEKGLQSVKEGCGVGDCGACTVVLARPAPHGGLEYRAVNSCLVLLPMVHGAQVITAEHLANEDELHPIQHAMVQHHGSQCGFCTPGMVMSMFALYKEGVDGKDNHIRKHLSGNLCRCTGYQPILEAVEASFVAAPHDHFTIRVPEVQALLEEIKADMEPIVLEWNGHRYLKAFTLEQALSWKHRYPDASLIAGATDLAPGFRLPKEPSVFIDIASMHELHGLEKEAETLVIGACRPLEDLSMDCREIIPALAGILDLYGSRQIRNMATAGGSLGTASPIGDLAPLLLAAGAMIEIRDLAGRRLLPLEAFFTGYRVTALLPGEIITKVHLPIPGRRELLRAYKVSRRRDVDISSLSAGFFLSLEKGMVKEARLAYGGMDALPRRVEAAEEYLRGMPWTSEVADAAAEIIRRSLSPITDVRAAADIRSLVAGNLLRKFFAETSDENNSTGYAG